MCVCYLYLQKYLPTLRVSLLLTHFFVLFSPTSSPTTPPPCLFTECIPTQRCTCV